MGFINRQEVAPKHFLPEQREWLQCLFQRKTRQRLNALRAENGFGADQVKRIDHPGVEETPRHPRAAFDHQPVDAAAAEVGQNLRYAAPQHLSTPAGEVGVGRKLTVAAHHEGHGRAVLEAGEAAGQFRVIRQHRAHADENGITLGAEQMDAGFSLRA